MDLPEQPYFHKKHATMDLMNVIKSLFKDNYLSLRQDSHYE